MWLRFHFNRMLIIRLGQQTLYYSSPFLHSFQPQQHFLSIMISKFYLDNPIYYVLLIRCLIFIELNVCILFKDKVKLLQTFFSNHDMSKQQMYKKHKESLIPILQEWPHNYYWSIKACRKTGRKDVNKQISRPFANKITINNLILEFCALNL